MSKINDGGPAFPVPSAGTGDPRDGMTTGHSGMSVRIWLAGQIAAGLEGKEDPRGYSEGCGLTVEQWRDQCYDHDAEYCLRKADAIIKAAGL